MSVQPLIKFLHAQYLAEAQGGASLDGFVSFCEKYLDANRPVESWPADANLGVRLSNNTQVFISPPVPAGGMMQDSGAISITSGESQPGQEGVVPINDARRIV